MAVNVKDGDDDALIELPAGFRFHPTNEEIITHYLTPKVLNQSFTSIAIGEADVNRSEPWDLPEKAKMGENEWFFFCQRDRKYPTGTRTNRATKSGYWKATGKDKEIFKPDGELVGMKKTLVFYKGRAPRGEKTNWVMHEFRLEGKFSYYTMSIPSNEDEWVVCRVFHKSTTVQSSPASYYGLNSFADELLNSPPQLPLLLDHTIGYPNFNHDQPEILQNNDYKNTLVYSSGYDFDINTYQSSSFTSEHQHDGKNPPCVTSESACYSPNYGLMKKKNVVDQSKLENLIPTINQSRKITTSLDMIRVNNDMTNIETSSTSMLSKDDLRNRDHDLDDNDDADVGPFMFSELDSLLQY